MCEQEKNNFKDYIEYNISVITDINNNNKCQFKCKRRYQNFNTFHESLIRKYPYLVIVKLPEKKINALNLNQAEKVERESRLNFYLNYLNNHDYLSRTNELKKFITEYSFVSLLIINDLFIQ